jgi:hypothetical protein
MPSADSTSAPASFNNDGDPDALTAPIAAVQLNDGSRVHEDYLVHARAARKLPGEGELDISALLQAVDRTGFTGPWCVEVNTPEFRSLAVDDAAHRTAAAASGALDAAGCCASGDAAVGKVVPAAASVPDPCETGSAGRQDRQQGRDVGALELLGTQTLAS